MLITGNLVGHELLCPKYLMYVNDVFITENWASRELLCPKLFNIYMHVSAIDIFITENWIFHPKFLYVNYKNIKMLF